MSMSDKELLQAVLRQDLKAFVEKTFGIINPGSTFRDNWSIDAVVEHLRAVEAGGIKRLLIALPPRQLKSTTASVAFPAWVQGRNPSRKIICASYGQELAALFSRQTKDVMSSALYRRTFPATILRKDKQTELELYTTQHGHRYSVSVGGGITGIGASLIIVDDPIKAQDIHSQNALDAVNDWFRTTLMSRLDNPSKDAIVVTMQRFHENDLIGSLLEDPAWQYLSIPAEAPTTRFYRVGPGPDDTHRYDAGMVLDAQTLPKKVLADIRRTMGAKNYSAQYLQDPLPDGGNLFDWNRFKFFDLNDVPKLNFDFVFQSWDVASSISETANYSVCTTWGVVGTKNFYLIDLKRVRMEHPALLQLAGEVLAPKHNPDIILVEGTGIGYPFWQALRARLGTRVIRTDPKDDKAVRAEKQTVLLDEGRVYVPSNAPWLDTFRKEVIAFPGGKYDDQVDSMVNFLDNAQKLLAIAEREGRLRNRHKKIEIEDGFTVTAQWLRGGRRLFRFS